jgi:hypothetical protein
MESYAGRWLRYENAFITLIPVDETQPRLGGKVQVKAFIMDWATFTPAIKTLYGIYSEDFITFGEYASGNPLDNEELLLKICDNNDTESVAEKTTYRFENNELFYKREVNTALKDPEVEHAISESKLIELIEQSWSETLFYGVGNKNV